MSEEVRTAIAPINAFEYTVTEEDTDELGHVNNRVYMRWLEESARQASALRGWGADAYLTRGFAWVARQHWIEYLRPCMPGDRITVYTWVEATAGARSLRRYCFKRGPKVCIVAATEWDFINLATRRAVDVPESVRAQFECVPADDRRLKELGIARPVRYAPDPFVE